MKVVWHITFEVFGGHTNVQVVFFGHIIYYLIGPLVSNTTFNNFTDHYKRYNINGILYEQDLKPTKKKFGLLLHDGSIIGI